MSRLVEDETFPYGGYAKACPADLVEGDGVRFAREGAYGLAVEQTCWLVETVAPLAEGMVVTLADRSVHVARVFADALHRPIEGMSADDGLHVRILAHDEPVWIRL